MSFLLYRIQTTADDPAVDLGAQIQALGLPYERVRIALQVHEADGAFDLVEDASETAGLTAPTVAAAEENFPLWSGPAQLLVNGAHLYASSTVNVTLIAVVLA